MPGVDYRVSDVAMRSNELLVDLPNGHAKRRRNTAVLRVYRDTVQAVVTFIAPGRGIRSASYGNLAVFPLTHLASTLLRPVS